VGKNHPPIEDPDYSTPGRPPPGKEYDTMNDELKPCPFCGGDFYFHEIEETGIEVRHNPIGDCPIEPLLGWYYTKEIALKTLNTRPLESALRAQLAEKDKELFAARELIDVAKTTIREKNTEIMRLKNLRSNE